VKAVKDFVARRKKRRNRPEGCVAGEILGEASENEVLSRQEEFTKRNEDSSLDSFGKNPLEIRLPTLLKKIIKRVNTGMQSLLTVRSNIPINQGITNSQPSEYHLYSSAIPTKDCSSLTCLFSVKYWSFKNYPPWFSNNY
jgi:hypothetical protein